MESFERKQSDIEKLLKEGKTVQIMPEGYSMYPLFVPGRDWAVIEPLSGKKPKRGDVVLYRRKNSILVLHRVYKCRGNSCYMVGDNQSETEGPIGEECIRGILIGVVRRGSYLPVSNPLYKLFSGLWLLLRPLRPALSAAAAYLKRVFMRR